MTIADNIQQVQEEISAACARANRDPASVKLIAVSKKKPSADIEAAIQAGLQHFGENRVEEAERKIPAVQAGAMGEANITWHMIGHIQSRKSNRIPSLFHVVHSLDSVKLAERLSRSIMEDDYPALDVLLQINISGEESKSGFEATGWQTQPAIRDALFDNVRQISALPGLNVTGLMTMAPIVTDMEKTRPIFADLAALRQTMAETLALDLPELSMGMTDDYPIAIEEGATMVRIGRAIFGERTD